MISPVSVVGIKPGTPEALDWGVPVPTCPEARERFNSALIVESEGGDRCMDVCGGEAAAAATAVAALSVLTDVAVDATDVLNGDFLFRCARAVDATGAEGDVDSST